MAIIYSYPTAVPELQDLLVGTEMAEQGGEGTPRTRTFTIDSIISLAGSALAGTYATVASVNLKANIASPTFTGTVTTINDAMINNVKIGRGGGNIGDNTAVGASSLVSNTTGIYNTTLGYGSLNVNETGSSNVAIGTLALTANVIGDENTAVGTWALEKSLGNNNTAVGTATLYFTTTGSNNTAIGRRTCYYGNFNNTTSIGYNAQPNADNQVVIGDENVTTTILRGAVTADSFAITEGLSTQYLMADGSTFTGSGAYAFPNLQQVTTTGPITTNNIEANSFVKTGGSSTQFLKADGSIDSNTYVPYTGAITNVNLGTNTITANSFVKPDGTSVQYLMANGNTSTMPTLQQVTNAQNTTTVGITATTNASSITPIRGINNLNTTGVQNSTGIFGESIYNGIGVKGVANLGYGVYGQSSVSYGIYGISYSESASIAGVCGEGSIIGTLGYSVSGTGVKGIGDIGVEGDSGVYGIGVKGAGATGIYGTGADNGVIGVGDTGVWGVGDNGAGGFFSTNFGAFALISNGSAAKPGGGTWSTYSDSRIKQNITPYAKGLAEILLVNTVNFEYNGLANTKTGIGYVGIIAQDMKEVFPETIGTYKAKLNKEDEEETELYMFDANALTFALINAVKQLSAEIELLKSK